MSQFRFSPHTKSLLKVATILILIALHFLSACRTKSTPPTDPDTYYTCSMDPQVIAYKPGACPICKMDLTLVKKKKGMKEDEVHLSEQQIELGNVRTDTIRNGVIGDRLVLTGTLNFDQMKSVAVSARVMGRIEKLYYKNVGDYITAGSPLFDLYSEELNNAKQEYLLALEKQKQFNAGAVVDVASLVQGAKNKLVLWGMTASQIRQLAAAGKTSVTTTFISPANGFISDLAVQEGNYTMEGGTIVVLADLSTLWVEAQVYASQLAAIRNISTAIVQLPHFDGREIKGRIEFVNPEINPDTRINLIRVSIPNPGNQLKPGMPAYVQLESPKHQNLALPIDAVIRDGKGATVWVKTGPGTFSSVMVTTGLESNDQIEILSGLKEGDVVVLSGAYLLHSEYKFKKGSDPMAGHQH